MTGYWRWMEKNIRERLEVVTSNNITKTLRVAQCVAGILISMLGLIGIIGMLSTPSLWFDIVSPMMIIIFCCGILLVTHGAYVLQNWNFHTNPPTHEPRDY